MFENPTRCTYHRLEADLHWYTHQQIRKFPECPATASRYVCLQVTYDGQSGDRQVNLCTGHELKVRELPGFKWSQPKEPADA